MKPSEVLRAARKLIERPESWTTGTFARNANGDELPREKRHKATAFCQLGACFSTGAEGDAVGGALVLLRRVEVTENLADWNDAPDRTHPEVLAAFDRAIALAEAEEGPASELERGSGSK